MWRILGRKWQNGSIKEGGTALAHSLEEPVAALRRVAMDVPCRNEKLINCALGSNHNAYHSPSESLTVPP